MVLEELFDFWVFCVVESNNLGRDVLIYNVEDLFFYVWLCFRLFFVLYDEGCGIEVECLLFVYEKMFVVLFDLLIFGFKLL